MNLAADNRLKKEEKEKVTARDSETKWIGWK